MSEERLLPPASPPEKAARLETIEFPVSRSIGFINHPENPYIFWFGPDKQPYHLNISVLQVALLSEDFAKYSADKIREALSDMKKGKK